MIQLIIQIEFKRYQHKQPMQTQKSIEIFLQKNNLHKTLQLFRNQAKKKSSHYGPNKTSQLSNIHKFTLNSTNQAQIRQHYQKTDPTSLNKVVKRLKRKNKQNLTQSNNPQISNITKMRFFQKLLQKQNTNNLNILDQHPVSQLKTSRIINSALEQSRQYDNEWYDQNQIGYDIFECILAQLPHYSQQITQNKIQQQNVIKYVQFPQAYYQNHQDKITKVVQNFRDKKKSKLPAKTIFKRQQNQDVYPIQDGDITYDSYDLKIIYDRQKTGFQQQRQLPIVINQVLAARYQVLAVLGQAQFAKAIQVKDLHNDKQYCIKIIQNSKQQNSKDFFDQSIDQIKLLRFISANCNTDQWHLITLHDFFYHKEHLMIVTQLLKDNLYQAYKMYPQYFNLQAIQNYSRQILKALDKLHSLHIIHTDLKPQNILIKSYSKQQLKVIDVGSSIFFHDRLSFYVQTRSYRAPQVIIGCPYDQKIDIWSFGCIIAQLYTGQVLFDSQSVAGLLAKMQGLRGPWPSWMIEHGIHSKKFFTKQLLPYQQIDQQQKSKNTKIDSQNNINGTNQYQRCRIFVPKLTNLKSRINCQDKLFIDFLSKCLKLDPTVRMSAKQALKHPFINQ